MDKKQSVPGLPWDGVKYGLDDIKRQVPGITTPKEKAEKPSYLKDEELFFRAMHR